jgi:hypothetical protein
MVRAERMNQQEVVDRRCREIYLQANRFFDSLESPMEFGFKLLNGPPLFSCPILFIGYQPGGGVDAFAIEKARRSDQTWPPVCEYATEQWILAKRMQKLFYVKYLETCVGMNAIFVRSPTVRRYRLLDRRLRKTIEEFCVARVYEFIDAIRPQRIVAIGFATLNLFGGGKDDLTNVTGRVLTKNGTIAGRKAIAMLHLSGARIAELDPLRIAERVRSASPVL